MFGANAFGWPYFAQPFLQQSIPIAGSDASGSVTEIASVKVVLSVTDANATTEATLPVGILVTDSNSVLTETISLKIPVADGNAVTSESVSVRITVYEPGAISTYADFPKFFVAYSQIPQTYPTYASIQTGPPPLPQLTEVAIVIFAQVTADVNGPTTEISALKAVLSAADAGTATEVAAIAEITQDANGATTEVASIRVSSADANGTVSEITSLAQIASDANGTTTEITSLRLIASDTNGTTFELTSFGISGFDVNGTVTETARLAGTAFDANGVVTDVISQFRMVDTDENGTVTFNAGIGQTRFASESGTATETATAVVQITYIYGTDTNGAVSEAVSLRLSDTDAGGGTEISSLGFATADVNGSVIENAGVSLSVSADSGVGAEASTLRAGISNYDQDGFIYEYATSVPSYLVITNDYSSTTEIASVTKVTITASDQNGYDTEIVSLRTAVSDSWIGASESASLAVPVSPLLDAGSGAESASLTVSGAYGDTSYATESASVVVRLSTADQNALTTESGQIVYKTAFSDSGTVSEAQRIGISVSDFGTGTTNAFLNRITLTVTDANKPMVEITSVEMHGQAPAGRMPMLIAVDGIDKTYLTAVLGDQR